MWTCRESTLLKRCRESPQKPRTVEFRAPPGAYDAQHSSGTNAARRPASRSLYIARAWLTKSNANAAHSSALFLIPHNELSLRLCSSVYKFLPPRVCTDVVPRMCRRDSTSETEQAVHLCRRLTDIYGFRDTDVRTHRHPTFCRSAAAVAVSARHSDTEHRQALIRRDKGAERTTQTFFSRRTNTPYTT